MKTISFLKLHGYEVCPICGEIEHTSYLSENGVCSICLAEAKAAINSLAIVEEMEENIPDEILYI